MARVRGRGRRLVLALAAGDLLYLVLGRPDKLRATQLLGGGAFYAVFLVVSLVTVL